MIGTEIDDLVQRWVRPEIRGISAYHVPSAAGMIKLDAMENPYVWPEPLRDEWSSLLRGVDVNRYPPADAAELKQALRDTMGIPDTADLVLGNGSDELIQMLAMTVGGPGRVIVSVEPSFVMYRMIAAFTGMRYQGIPLCAEDYSLATKKLLQAVEREQPALVFIAYPNNPTANLFAESSLLDLIEAAPGLVVIDEAYAAFTDASFMARLGRYPNLLVMRTLSKMGLAGLRLGLLAGPPHWISEIDKTRLPYNIGVLTQVSAHFALRHQTVFDQQTEAIRQARGELFAALGRIQGITPYPSEANFILCRLPAGRAPSVHAGLQRAGVLVKNLHGSHPLLQDCLRITVGSEEENTLMLDALQSVL